MKKEFIETDSFTLNKYLNDIILENQLKGIESIETITDDFNKAGKEENHFTRGMNPCIGILFYNKVTKESYILHSPLIEDSGLISKIIHINKESGNKKENILVDCYGASIDPSISKKEKYNLEILKDREYTEKIVREIFPKENISFNWVIGRGTSIYLNKKEEKQYVLTERLFLDEYY